MVAKNSECYLTIITSVYCNCKYLKKKKKRGNMGVLGTGLRWDPISRKIKGAKESVVGCL